ncbi:MAG: FkbM family methyltransferase [Bacteroidota bacterium]
MLRKIVLKILKATAFDFKISHHYTKSKFFLNSYQHKGYWFHGEKREQNTVKNFIDWIRPNDFVLEIGGHIGYFTVLFANLVGENGTVYVFEPSKKNIFYLTKNIQNLPEKIEKIVSIVEKGAGDLNGRLEFFIDPITGQNNSFVKNFDGFFKNREVSAETNAELISEQVEVVKLDTFFSNLNKYPNFVKIDVEGFEWNVISGFKKIIEANRPNLMIEIQADQENIINYFLEINYEIFNDKMMKINSFDNYEKLKTPNIFFKYN